MGVNHGIFVANPPSSGSSGTADALQSASTVVDVSAATAPSAGQILTAVDSTHATWQANAYTSPSTVFYDPTTGGTIDPALWSAPSGGVASQTGGSIQLVSSATNYIQSVNTYDFCDKQLTFKMPSPDMSSANISTHIIISESNAFSAYALISFSNNVVTFNLTPVASTTIAYNASADAWLRMKNQGNIWTFQTSADGVTFVTRFASTYPWDSFNASFIFLRMFNSTGGSVTSKWSTLTLSDLSNS